MDYFDLLELLEWIIFAPFIIIFWVLKKIYSLIKYILHITSVPIISLIVMEHKTEILAFIDEMIKIIQLSLIR
ncbi:hypothetical protein [uncultured Lactococcus sp.]|uniref:hypothetical protein n=1 Tax=uncultured Lactococcus sp. TaxID=167973 RepID=UPI0027DE3A97|nr:hypothetical protein [uncultured Lactococcus sp.]